MEPDPDKRYRYIRLIGALGTVPLILGVGPLLGFFAGRWLDNRFRTTPWLQFVLLALGFAAAVRYILRVLGEVRKDLDRM